MGAVPAGEGKTVGPGRALRRAKRAAEDAGEKSGPTRARSPTIASTEFRYCLCLMHYLTIVNLHLQLLNTPC